MLLKNPNPIAVEHYSNDVGDMIDIQYHGTPKPETTDLKNAEGNLSGWFTESENEKHGSRRGYYK